MADLNCRRNTVDFLSFEELVEEFRKGSPNALLKRSISICTHQAFASKWLSMENTLRNLKYFTPDFGILGVHSVISI